jgi:predicted nucleotidyltransferase
MDLEEIKRRIKKDLNFLENEVEGILLFGSVAAGEAYEESDIDICLVAPETKEGIKLWTRALAGIRDTRYDLRIFEQMPLFLKMEVIEKGVVIFSRDVCELYEYFYPFRRIWEDQKHRQMLSKEEALAMFAGQ